MKRVEAAKCTPGMIVKDWDGKPYRIVSVSEPFDGRIGPLDEGRRSRWGRVVTIEFDEGPGENVPVSDMMHVYEEGE